MSILERLAAIAASKKSPISEPAKLPASTRQDWSVQVLSPKQKATICQLAKKAFTLQHDLGLIDDNETTWRRDQQKIACGKASLRDCGQKQYLSLIAHFQQLAGLQVESKKTWSRTGRAKGSPVARDTYENRAALNQRISDALTAHAETMKKKKAEGQTIGWPYVYVIVKNKFAGTKMADLRADQLEQLFYTVANRIAKKEGVPERGQGRNKGMRKK